VSRCLAFNKLIGDTNKVLENKTAHDYSAVAGLCQLDAADRGDPQKLAACAG